MLIHNFLTNCSGVFFSIQFQIVNHLYFFFCAVFSVIIFFQIDNIQMLLIGTALIDFCHLVIKYLARPLIDSGFQTPFISERLFNLIKLPYESNQAQVLGVNLTVAAQPRKPCQLNIGSSVKPHIQIVTFGYVLPQLAGNLPSRGFVEGPSTFATSRSKLLPELAD